jgi:hypothetical protein
MIEQENGLLPIASFDANTSWDDLMRIGAPHLNASGLQRLKGAMAATTKCVVIERHYIDKDYRDTFANFHAKKFSTPDSRCIRLHFFAEPVTPESLRDAKAIQPHYLGYAIIRPTRPNCVGRTLLTPAGRGLTNAHISVCKERISIQGTELSVEGFPFISQDADVTVCAQSALWTVARYFSNRYAHYREMYPYGLTTLTTDYSIGRILPSGGLAIWQIAEAFRQLGFAPLIYDRKQLPTLFDHLMYTYIESGIPVLAAVPGHVFALFGHRSDYSKAAALAPIGGSPFIFSSALNEQFIGNDDNGVPYQVVGGATGAGTMPYKISDVQQFIAPLPERVFLSAENVQSVMTAIMTRQDVGFAALSPSLAGTTPLVRLFLTTGKAFKKRLQDRGMGSAEVADIYRSLPLPHFIWVCEIAHQKDYPKRVVGEIVWDATRNAYEPDGWIALHYPEMLIVDVGSALNGPQRLLRFPVVGGGDYPIYENNLIHV